MTEHDTQSQEGIEEIVAEQSDKDQSIEEKPPQIRTVLDWARRKGFLDAEPDKRWMLCLAATQRGWLPEQQDDAVDEVSEADFDAAMRAVEEAHNRLKNEHGGRHKVKALVHRDLLVGVFVKRLIPSERNAVFEPLQKLSDKEAGAMARSRFQSTILWPSLAAFSAVRDYVPNIDNVMVDKWLKSMGSEASEVAKKP
jgi:hypothetical protein